MARPVPRDLKKEMEEAAASSPSVAEPASKKRPRLPDEAPPEYVFLQQQEGMLRAENLDAVSISIDDWGFQWAQQTRDEAVMDAFMKIVGIYWYLGEHNCYPCFRQEKCDGSNNNQLILHVLTEPADKAGWYIAPVILHKPEVIDENAVAWGPLDTTVHSAAPPSQLHTPYWKKKKAQGVIIEPFHAFAKRAYENLKKELNEVREELAVVKSLAGEALGAGGEEAPAKGAKSSGRGGGGGGPKTKGGGGWMIRAAPLAAAVLEEWWGTANDIANSWYELPDSAGPAGYLIDKERSKLKGI